MVRSYEILFCGLWPKYDVVGNESVPLELNNEIEDKIIKPLHAFLLPCFSGNKKLKRRDFSFLFTRFKFSLQITCA
jgi:hypothetical protein